MEYRGLLIEEYTIRGCCGKDPSEKYYKIVLKPKKGKNPKKDKQLFKGIEAAKKAIDDLFGEERPWRAPKDSGRRIELGDD